MAEKRGLHSGSQQKSVLIWGGMVLTSLLFLLPACRTTPQVQGPTSSVPEVVTATPIPYTPAIESELLAKSQQSLANANYTIMVVPRPSVLRVIHHFMVDPDANSLMEAALTQGAKHRLTVEEALSRDGLPKELSFVAQAESAFLDPALKGKGLAMGLWQMIPSTARHYGLIVNETIDNRTDAFMATDAAVRHLVDLNATFNDWPLVITSFYAGAGIVEQGMQLSNTQDAWSLIEHPTALPQECRAYLPLVYAHAIITATPELFGFHGGLETKRIQDMTADYERFYTHRYPKDLTFGE